MDPHKSKEQINKEYIAQYVNPVVEKLILDLLKEKPTESVEFMITWLQSKGRQIFSGMKKSKRPTHKDVYGESSEGENEEEFMDDDAVKNEKLKKKEKPSRTSVSAEAYGVFHKKGDYKPKVVPKSNDQLERLKTRLNEAFMFASLDPKELEIVLNSFEEKVFEEGDTVIRQGDDGDNLYVIDDGVLDCYKRFSRDEDPKHIKLYQPGDSFGELALLYNAPRAATIIAKTKSVLFSLDRECFNHIVKDAASKKRERYEEFLAKVEVLQSMDPYERAKISDALRPLKFKKDEFVVKEGEKGDVFFFVEEGEAVASKRNSEDNSEEVVYHYKTGDYFGELALLRDSPRAANIIAKTDLSLVALDRQSFKRLLGPLEDILKRNFVRYEKFLT